jgi:uncharacterized protein YgbK (DUF1537 family)
VLLGCIADDFTGATDLANTLVREGMASVVTIGVPRADFSVPAADAVVVALKSRSCPAPEAVAAALAALEWLRRAGARQFFFKYCSTFDSTDAGNIGPVAEALLDALGADFTVACPAFPANERTVYLGHLFVGETLLAESGMRRHPLNPMTDSNLVRVLQRQSRRKVGLVPFAEVERGVSAVRAAIERLRAAGVGLAIVDALTEAHLLTIGTACAGLKLLTGGSGLALGLPENFRRAGLLGARAAGALPQLRGASAVLAGSCSEATRRQVARMRVRWPSAALDPGALEEEGDRAVRRVLEWAAARLGAGPVLIYSTAEPDAVERTQAALGRERAGHLVESAMARIAQGLVASGVRRLVVAGGETSGAVVGALGIEALRIGPEIAPGVPWTASAGEPPLLLALKSGNFGGEDFFLDAFAMLETADRA